MSDAKILDVIGARVILLVMLITPVSAQTGPDRNDQPVLEIVQISCGGYCEKEITRIFADGRYISQSEQFEMTKSGKPRPVAIQTQKRLNPDEVAELTRLAEQTDFVQAQSEYVKIVQDHPSYTTITYRSGIREKKITVANYYALSAEEKAKIPTSVMQLLRRAFPYSFQ